MNPRLTPQQRAEAQRFGTCRVRYWFEEPSDPVMTYPPIEPVGKARDCEEEVETND